MPLKNPVIFTILVLAVLIGTGMVIYIYGLPLLQDPQFGCTFGEADSFGCSSSFGFFMTCVVVVLGFALTAIWLKFGQQ
jgi:hypothetical protein